MKNLNPILIVEDDNDDCELIQGALQDIGVTNEQLCFKNGEDALTYLRSTTKQTFLILSDINMPRLSGIEFKQAINEDEGLKKKSIPFVFLTTSNHKREIEVAYDLMVQGFFTKPSSIVELQTLLKMVVSYWDTCKHPNFIKTS